MLRKVLRDMHPHARDQASAAIVQGLDRVMASISGGIVLLYAALPAEANVWGIVETRPGFRYALPRITTLEPRLECRAFSDRRADLIPGAFGIDEPDPGRCPLIPFAELDLVIVPGLAFTPAGERLGRGGGFYDRLLSHPDVCARRIGVCFDCQVVDSLPVESHDEGVDVVVTETRQWGVL